MTDNKEKGAAGALAGLGVALGAAALGAYLTTRRSSELHGDDAPGYTARRGFGKYDVTGRSVTIRKPRAELYAFWRNFANLPQVMENLEKISVQGPDGHAVWTIKSPTGTVDVETEIVREVENELIAWRSVDGSEIATKGRVTFRDAPGDRGTQVQLIIAYEPPGGKIGKSVAKLFMREPAVQARHDLKRFKMLMETGEIATSARTRDQTRAAQQDSARENA